MKHPAWFKQVYRGFSLGLIIPLLAWPWVSVFGLDTAWGVDIVKNWLLSAVMLLLVSQWCDAVLDEQGGMEFFLSLMWMAVFTYISVKVLENHAQAWLLAMAFAVKAGYDLPVLWQGEGHWWHWDAWLRDSTAALVMFMWLIFWS